jgi:CheY-like chemotaxis protein
MTALVLIVEDDPDVRNLISLRVKNLGHDVVTASTGEEALEVARRLSPALVVLDIGLPGIDGWEVLRRLRAEPATASIGVLVVSVLDPSDDHPPIDGYVIKPFRAASIDRVVISILGHDHPAGWLDEPSEANGAGDPPT